MSQLLLPVPIELTVACRTSRGVGAKTRRHPVTIEVDGTVTTPHDLDAERVAAAMGGYLSCLDLVDRAAPAFQQWLRAIRREDPRPLRTRDAGTTWHPAERGRCCAWRGYDAAQSAAAHGRDPGHLAAVHDADPHQVRALIKGAAIPEPPAPRAEPERTLWACGLQPERVRQVARAVPCRDTLSVEFHLAVLVRKPDLEWLAVTLAELDGSADLATWLAWTMQPDDRRDPRLRVEWLRPGIAPRAVLPLVGAGYTVADVHRLATAFAGSDAQAALALLDWVEHGYRPTVTDLVEAGRMHLVVPPEAPAQAAVERLREGLGQRAVVMSDTDLALALVRHGTVWHAKRAMAR